MTTARVRPWPHISRACGSPFRRARDERDPRSELRRAGAGHRAARDALASAFCDNLEIQHLPLALAELEARRVPHVLQELRIPVLPVLQVAGRAAY